MDFRAPKWPPHPFYKTHTVYEELNIFKTSTRAIAFFTRPSKTWWPSKNEVDEIGKKLVANERFIGVCFRPPFPALFLGPPFCAQKFAIHALSEMVKDESMDTLAFFDCFDEFMRKVMKETKGNAGGPILLALAKVAQESEFARSKMQLSIAEKLIQIGANTEWKEEMKGGDEGGVHF